MIEKYDSLISFHTFKERVSNAYSFYPKKSGIGLWINSLYEKFEEKGGKIIKDANMIGVGFKNNKIDNIDLKNNLKLKCDKVISTISPAFLFNISKIALPKNILKPAVVNTVLIHMAFDKKFLINLYYLNCFDHKMISFRVTLYSNFREILFRHSQKYLTVECFLDDDNCKSQDIISIVKDELKKMYIIDNNSKCTFSKLIRLKNGFPIPNLDFQKSSLTLINEARSVFDNVSFLGRGAGESFYLQDVIKNTYYEMKKLKRLLTRDMKLFQKN